MSENLTQNTGAAPESMTELEKQYNNDNATTRVPLHESRSTFDIAMVCCGFCICMSGLFTGAAMALGLPLSQALIAAVIGNLILSLYSGAVGYAGAKERVATSMLARHSFGRIGSFIISLVLAITMLGWYSVQVGFFGNTMAALFPSGGFITSAPVAAFWGGILMLLTAYVGYRGLSVLSKIAVPLITIIAIIAIVFSVRLHGGWEGLLKIAPTQPISISTAIVMVVGSFAAGGSAQADITRYAKTPKAAVLGTVIGYMLANTFIIVAGFLTCLATGNGDLPAAMLSLGLGFPALIVLIAAQWTTNDNNLYTASLGLSNIFHIKKKHLTLASGILATIVGALGLSNYFTNWLVILGVGLPPMAGIIVADYFFIHKQSYEFGKGTRYCKWNLLAFIAWIIGAAVGFAVPFGIAAINSMVVGFAVYMALMLSLGKTRKGFLGEVIEE